MSDDIEALKKRVAALESMVALAAEEVGRARQAARCAEGELKRLVEYLAPDASAEAIANALPDDSLALRSPRDAVWRHIAPTYKVHELVESALHCLRGAV